MALSRNGLAGFQPVHDNVRFAVDWLRQWRCTAWAGIRFNASALATVYTSDSGCMVEGQIGQEPCHIEEGRYKHPGNKKHSAALAWNAVPEDKAYS